MKTAKPDLYLSEPSLFLSCEHAGNHIPARYTHLFSKNRGVLQTHRGSDPGALILAKEISRLTKTRLYFTEVSRLVVDMNRSPNSATVLSKWTRTLAPAEQKRLFDKLYWPYRNRIGSAVDQSFERSHRLAHLGLHSFSPHLDPARRGCDIGVLFDPNSQFESQLSKNLRAQLVRLFPNFGIRMNFPYRGDADGLTTDLRNKWGSTRYAGLEIEFNQALLRKVIRENNVRRFAVNFAACLAATLAEI